MPWYTFRGPVRVTEESSGTEVTDAERLRTLDGLVYDEETLSERIDDPDLEDVDAEGGTIELRWRDERLEVCSAYEVAAELDPAQIDVLRAFTWAEWEHGLAEALITEHLDRTGLRLDLTPDDETSVSVEVEES